MFSKIFLARLIFFFIILCNSTYAVNSVEFSNAWISEAPPTVTTLAGYLDIKNVSNLSITLTQVSSPDFSSVEIHRTVTKGDMVSMEKQSSFEIPAGEIFKLSPGGYHLMLINPEKALLAGNTVTLILTFSDGSVNTVVVTVERRRHTDHIHLH